MDGKGRCIDNTFIERLWRSLKYECVYLHAWETGSQARNSFGRWTTGQRRNFATTVRFNLIGVIEGFVAVFEIVALPRSNQQSSFWGEVIERCLKLRGIDC